MNLWFFYSAWIAAYLFLPLPLLAQVDTFGIQQMYPTKTGTRSWNSAHWNNGITRVVKYDSDPYDPADWTEDHSGGTDGFRIDGNGTMTMSGSGPRFHINSLRNTKTVVQFFRDVEFTAYYQRRGTAGQNYGGMVLGVRSGPLGHASPGGNNCDATTYYARFRNDGKWDFEKELNHPGSSYWSGSGYNKQDLLWGGAKLPTGRWIGMKYVVFNVNNNSAVKLELYIDSVSNGNPVDGGYWEMVGTVTDSGSWPSGDVSGCGYEQDAVIVEGHGTMLMRTDGDTAVYRMVSVREIDPSKTSPCKGKNHRSPEKVNSGLSCRIFSPGGPVQHARYYEGSRYAVYSLRGKLLTSGTTGRRNGVTGGTAVSTGVYIVVPPLQSK